MEEAVNELINMLLEFDHSHREEVERVEEETSTESKTAEHQEYEGMLTTSEVSQRDWTKMKQNYLMSLICP